jgi:hypothetical protein
MQWNAASHPAQKHESNSLVMNSDKTAVATAIKDRRTKRRLKPEIASRLAARRRAATLQSLYQRPAQELSPEEIAQLKSAFFAG